MNRSTVLGTAATAVLLGWAAKTTETDAAALLRGLPAMATFVLGDPALPGSGFFPPDLGRLNEFLGATADTLAIATMGTALAAPGGLILGLLASHNGASLLIGEGWFAGALRPTLRRTLDALRAVNELIFAMVFVAAVGLGPFAGVLALAVHTTGVLGKLFSEAVESAEPGPVAAVRGSGASRIVVARWGLWPQVAPHFVSFLLYRFETNIRAATVVGLCGAGGIGYQLWETVRGFEYRHACTLLLLIVGLVTATDALCGRLRRAVS